MDLSLMDLSLIDLSLIDLSLMDLSFVETPSVRGRKSWQWENPPRHAAAPGAS
jgi:hypothetical protein